MENDTDQLPATDSSLAALVTGANKGIGLEIVKKLSRQFNGIVYLTARDVERGKVAEKTLQDEGFFSVSFLHLDVTCRKSIEKARDFIEEKHGGLDILINNAGILIRGKSEIYNLSADQSAEAVKATMATNFTGVLDVCTILFPILRAHARIVNVSANVGSLRQLKSADLKKQLASDQLTVHRLQKIMEDYIQIAVTGNAVESGYPDQYGPYAMSKIGVTALTRIHQRNFDQDKSRPDIVVNACGPGYVATDINNHAGKRTTEQGADTPVYLALLAPSAVDGDLVKPRGEFVYDRIVMNWAKEEV